MISESSDSASLKVVTKYILAASGAIAVFAVLCVLGSIFPSKFDTHGGSYLLALAVFVLMPVAVYLFLVGLWFHRRWHGRWVLAFLPVLAVLVVVVLGIAGVMPLI